MKERIISAEFIEKLQTGFLKGLTKAIIDDNDLDLQIRHNYIEVYFKGHSLLNLKEVNPSKYNVFNVDEKIIGEVEMPNIIIDENSVKQMIDSIRHLKHNVQQLDKSSVENEYEQMIIRTNNYSGKESNLIDNEYFIIDRQFKIPPNNCFDLLGIYCKDGLRKIKDLPLCLFEIKYGKNINSQNICEQLQRYEIILRNNIQNVTEMCEEILKLKLKLGFYKQKPARISKMEEITISSDITRVQYILIFVDYNPKSSSLNARMFDGLAFRDQIRVFKTGFGLWNRSLKSLDEV